MNNYEYLVASLPLLTPDWKFTENTSPESFLQEIREGLSRKDDALVDFLLRGFEDAELTSGFYAEALAHPNAFLREYFRFDLNLRNAKVRYLNKALGRPAEMDVMTGLSEEEEPLFEAGEFGEAAKADAALNSGDILSRERALDDLKWAKIDELTVFDYFDINALLGFIAKLQIVARWFRLDEAAGRELFKKLAEEVRGTFKGVNYDSAQG